MTPTQLADRLEAVAARTRSFEEEQLPRAVLDADLGTLERWAEKHGTDNPSAIDQVMKHARYGEETFRAMIDATGDYEEDDDADEDDRRESRDRHFRESPLDASVNGDRLEILESTGGPASGYHVEYNPRTGAIERARFWFQDWFEGKAFEEITDTEYPATWEYLGFWAELAAEGVLRNDASDDE